MIAFVEGVLVDMIGHVLTFTTYTALLSISFFSFLGSVSELQVVRIVVILSVVMTYTAGSPTFLSLNDECGIL